MPSALIILFACIESEYLSKDAVESWATMWVSKLPCPPVWLIDLLGANNQDQQIDILRERLIQSGLLLDQEYAEFLLGFYYLNFINEKISLNEFESLAVDVVDAYDLEGVDPELLNKLFKKPISIDKAKEVAELYFGRYREKSEKGYFYLSSGDLEKKEASFFAGL